MKTIPPSTLRFGLLIAFVVALVSIPFVIFGQEFVLPMLESRQQQAGALTVLAVILLMCDSVAPVPVTLVIWFLAEWAGLVAGIVGGTLGLGLGVIAAGWFGRGAVGRLAPRFIPDAELARLRESLQRRLMVTLACLRSVPVLAETSVIVAAATGIPVGRLFRVTLLPNFVVAAIYSVAAHYSVGETDSLVTAAITFVATIGLSLLVWRLMRDRRVAGSAK